MKGTVVALLACLAVALAQPQQFQADVTIGNDPSIKGFMKGVIDYDFPNQWISYRYTIGPQELTLYSTKLRYLLCPGVCEAQTWQDPQPKFFKEGGDAATGTSITVGSRTCSGFSKSSGIVSIIYVDGSSNPCRADLSDGRQYIFENIRGIDANQVNAIAGKGCPAQQCGKLIDFVFVLDESGSITPSSFSYMKDFITNVVNSYTFGPLGSAVGITMFASSSRNVITINPDQTSVLNAIRSIQQLSGNTCIGCGIYTGHQQFVSYTRAGAQKVMLFMTDGQNNRQTAQFPTILQNAKNYGILIFSIGVGNDVDKTEINKIGSTIPGVQTVFFSPSYSQLNTIVNQLVIVTCVDIPGNPCGAGCQGFCSCGKTCVCPSSCDDSNPCTDDNCNAAVNGAGCSYSAHSCNDDNACTTDTCDPASGCKNPALVCTPPTQCLTASCDPGVGCQYKAKNCDDGDVCFADSCNDNTGCVHTPVNCDRCKNPKVVVCDPIPCATNECDPADGVCKSKPVDCNDNNPCSVDSCNPTLNACQNPPLDCNDNNACTTDFCSQVANATAGIVVGCNNIPVNETSYCDDQNACTTDTCIPATGCNNTAIVCNDTLVCTTDLCNSILGCQFVARDCASDPSLPKLKGNCYIAACTEAKGCYVKEYPGRKIDKCGVCDGDGKSCVAINTAQAAGIAAGVLAAIIIGAIAVCAILGAIGGKKGYDIYMRNRNNMTGANTNPLYTDNGLSGTNPMYTDQNL